MTSNQQLPIIILVDERDDILHTALWPQCKDLTCPCQDEVEDEIILSMPTEQELDAQERSVLSGADVPTLPMTEEMWAEATRFLFLE
jgi:hypothetical protein